MVRYVTDRIRDVDPERVVVADETRWGRDPVYELADAPVAQSTRGYEPMPVSHQGANWPLEIPAGGVPGADNDREMLELLQAHWPAPSLSHRAAPRPPRATVFRDRRLGLSSGTVPYHWLLGPTAVAVRHDPVVPVGAVHSPPAVCPISAAAPPKIYCA